ncbi:MAG: LUD domain-containing protein [Haliscomenobacter sp.]|nr:LUD domain-containing protein [Haliscomenobacter sp.]MBP9078523.1 LUD domain-containing protein [Haliscomenobacter sp.]
MSKKSILRAIRQNQPQGPALPELPSFASDAPEAPLAAFQAMVAAMGGQVANAADYPDLGALVSAYFPGETSVASTVPGFPGNIPLQNMASPAALETVGLAVIPAPWGVAENGAVWVTEKECLFRVLPFIAQHLMVVLAKDRILSNMHEAYQRVQVDETGFGVFIAGPSKTADIEQALVIGAQAARSFTVVLE